MQIMNELFKTNYFIISLFKIIYLVFMTYFLSKNKLITYIYKDTLKDTLWNLLKKYLYVSIYMGLLKDTLWKLFKKNLFM